MTRSYRSQFDIPRDVCYLNAAYMTPQPRRVFDAVLAGAEQRAKAWKLQPIDFFTDVEALRSLYASQINCPPDNIAIVPSASYGVAVAANNLDLKKNDVILVLEDQFPSNYYSWKRSADKVGARIETVRKQDNQSWTTAFLERIDELGEQISLAALEQHHWASAEALDLDVVIPKLKEIGAKTVLDLTQTVGAVPTDISALAPDFMVTAPYKWQFCPYGVSFLYVADNYFDGTPIEDAWLSRDGAEDFSQLADYTDEFQNGARRFDAGQRSSFANIAGAIAALEALADWGIVNIADTLQKTNQHIADTLESYGFELTPDNRRGPHFQSAIHAGIDTHKLAQTLITQNVFVSQRGDRLRLAPHLYTDQEDLDHFEDSLRKAMLQIK